MSFDRHRDRDERRWDTEEWELRRRERDSWTDIAYLIVAGLALVLVARLWSRVIQPWAAGVLAQLSVTDLVTAGLVVLVVLVVTVVRRVGDPPAAPSIAWVAGGEPAPAHRSHRPDGQRRKELGAGPGPGWPKAITQ